MQLEMSVYDALASTKTVTKYLKIALLPNMGVYYIDKRGRQRLLYLTQNHIPLLAREPVK